MHNRRMELGRIVGVIGKCSAGGCVRPAVRYVELGNPRGRVSGVVCQRCAEATSAAGFLLEMIPSRNSGLVAARPLRAPPLDTRQELVKTWPTGWRGVVSPPWQPDRTATPQ